MAHIFTNADGGDVSVDNLILILLGRNCHREVDGTRTEPTPAVMRQWKINRNREIHQSLVFFSEWLTRNRIRYEFDDPCNLTKLTLNRKHDLFLFYEYCLSVSGLYKIPVSDGLLVVNLYNWNGGCITPEAKDYAAGQGIKVFTQNEFFQFAHRSLK